MQYALWMRPPPEIRNLRTRGNPHAVEPAHILDQFGKRVRARRFADQSRVQCDRNELRRFRGLAPKPADPATAITEKVRSRCVRRWIYEPAVVEGSRVG